MTHNYPPILGARPAKVFSEKSTHLSEKATHPPKRSTRDVVVGVRPPKRLLTSLGDAIRLHDGPDGVGDGGAAGFRGDGRARPGRVFGMAGPDALEVEEVTGRRTLCARLRQEGTKLADTRNAGELRHEVVDDLVDRSVAGDGGQELAERVRDAAHRGR